MCGIAGILALRGTSTSGEHLPRMTGRLAHRGPDDSDVWVSEDGRIALGHRRLAILDLSPAGHQPMTSASGRYTISYNGEVYNFSEMGTRLEKESGVRFHGHSDTEVMLAAFEEWGMRQAIEQFVGMFAFAVWDRDERCLWLARDRLGVKPLYYCDTGRALIFASELKALLTHPECPREVSRDALALYLHLGYVPAPQSILRNVRKLPPGRLLRVEADGCTQEVAYWDLAHVASSGLATPFLGSEEETASELDRLLREAVRLRMVADVPLGAFLSGGIDSSAVVALMQVQSARPVNTYTIGFHEAGYNEAEYAAAVARHLKAAHTELYVTNRDALDVIPSLPDIYDEPFADASQIPTFLVSKLARAHVTVSLSGDGGDELFGGYNRYLFVNRFWQRLRAVPLPVRRLISDAIARVTPQRWDHIFAILGKFVSEARLPALPGQKLHKAASLLEASDLVSLHLRVIAQWPFSDQLVVGLDDRSEDTLRQADGLVDGSDVLRQMFIDTCTYLPDDILTKLDRASMGVGLEAREPLLDHRVVEFAWRIPEAIKFRNGQGKWILRKVLSRYVPDALIDRPKMGFSVPIGAWLRGPLREWAETYLSSERLEREGFLDVAQVRRIWEQHLLGRVDRGGPIWTVLMFEVWLERMGAWN